MKVYLAGPINGCNDDDAQGWRDAFQAELALIGAKAIDPMVRDYRGREDDCVSEIVQGDKRDIAGCDVFVAHCWQVSWGTAMEILYAYQEGKTVILVCPPGQRISPWQRYHSDAIVGDLSAALEDLKRLALYGLPERQGKGRYW